MTLDDMQAGVARMGHPPGWTVTIAADHWGQPVATFAATVPDARTAGTVDLAIRSHVPCTIGTVDDLARWVKQRHGVIALHEVDEYVTLDGAPLLDPHTGR